MGPVVSVEVVLIAKVLAKQLLRLLSRKPPPVPPEPPPGPLKMKQNESKTKNTVQLDH